MRFAVAEIPRGRADDLGDLVGVLEFGAVDLDDGAGAAEENFGGGFNDAGLAGAGGADKKQIADGAPGGVESSGEDLEQLDEGLNAVVLADDFRAQGILKLNGVPAAYIGIQRNIACRHDRLPSVPGNPGAQIQTDRLSGAFSSFGY